GAFRRLHQAPAEDRASSLHAGAPRRAAARPVGCGRGWRRSGESAPVKLPVYQIDAFASRPFAGNPAVVCCPENWLEDSGLVAIAAEHNISTTAFLVESGTEFEIRYFAPIGELSLVGHASLAAAHVILRRLRPDASQAVLRRRDGLLRVLSLEDG